MAEKYNRTLSLVVADSAGNGIDLSALRVRFNVQRGDHQTPNSCDARIYNLSRETATLVENEFTQIALQAGYGGDLNLVFRGVITQTRRGRIDQRDSYLDITAADGDEAYNYSSMALTFARGTQPVNDIRAFVASFAKPALGALPAVSIPITQGYTAPLPPGTRSRGRVYYGLTRDCLRKFARTYDVKWSIQDGRLVLIKNGYYIPGEPVVISPSTGLIGVPEQTQRGLSMRVLLNPNIKIGQLVKLEQSAINQVQLGLNSKQQGINLASLKQALKLSSDGLYYVMRADHVGDTRADEWYTDITALAVDASVPANAVPGVAIGPTPIYKY